MDAHELYCRQMVNLRTFEMERDHPGVRLAREVSSASPASRVPSSLRQFVRRLAPAPWNGRQGDARVAVAVDLGESSLTR